LALKFAFISEVKHFPSGPKKCNFLEVGKSGSMNDKRLKAERKDLEDRIQKDLEDRIQKDLENRSQKDLEDRIQKGLEDRSQKDLEDRSRETCKGFPSARRRFLTRVLIQMGGRGSN